MKLITDLQYCHRCHQYHAQESWPYQIFRNDPANNRVIIESPEKMCTDCRDEAIQKMIEREKKKLGLI